VFPSEDILSGDASAPGSCLDDFKLKVDLFAARDGVQVLLPEFANEAKAREAMIQVDKEFEARKLP
jgi:hypothetical protein